ncbi:f8488e2b-6897-49aa-ae16-f72d598b0550 [Thermothielavioides terrestris]|uniref:F8488e2b-6897-49aa-ae16-f72d598b0550 n=1 Tax=Thermothielavioides terrestris TaxID=2587410 RepID=A0A446BT40_9PEZI|nr:f8488e2b-6897-49aa-ae16-f72d598b0550 [Thermothielavioides terrestris]
MAAWRARGRAKKASNQSPRLGVAPVVRAVQRQGRSEVRCLVDHEFGVEERGLEHR